ncbi:SRPBCC family protein [Halorubrum sp. DTA46]|uniref:SRPBCC family protein n=1 Tax=Halorubrum sp. DTA46 TaxID=3402162 RepID=UPI003AAC62A7
MHSYRYSVDIEAPVESVFAFDTDPRNWPRTMASLTDLEIIEETGDTVQLKGTYSLLGIKMEGEITMTVVEPNAHVVTEFRNDRMHGTMHNRYAETETGTRLELEAEYEFGDSLLGRLTEPVATRYNNRQFKNHLEHTKDLVEAEATVVAASDA